MTAPSGGQVPIAPPAHGRLARGAALVAGLVGLAVLVGWWLEVPALRSGIGNGAAINPATAVMFLLAAVSIWIASLEHATPPLRLLGTVCGAMVFLVAGLKLAAPLIGLSPAFDQIPFRSELAALGRKAPKPMTAGSAIIYLMIGTALLLARARREAGRLLSRSIGLFLALLGILMLFTFVYRRVTGTGPSERSSGLGIIIGFTALSAALTIAGPSKTGPGHKEADTLALRGKINAAFVVAVAILILTGALSIWSTVRSRNADRLQEESSARRAQILTLLSSLQDAETGARGFLLTGKPEFLGPYRAAVDSLPAILRRTEALLGAWGPHARRLDALQPLVHQRVAFLAEAVRLQEARRTAESIAMMRTGRGKAVMDEIRRQIASIVAEEDALNAQLEARVLRANRISLTTSVIAAFLAVCFLILAGLAINQDFRKCALAETALRHAVEAAEAANRAKSDFLAKMSHELRTPLNSIIGFSEILEDEGVGPLNDKQRRYVTNVLLSGRNLLQLINDILDLSKVEAGRMELAPSEFDVRAALEQVRGIVATLADKKGLSVQLDVSADLPFLSADQAKFKQIMYNLLGNAIKFTPEGGRVDVTARLVGPSGNGSTTDVLEVAVADTGIGIPPEDLTRIFNEFEQVNTDSRREQEGTGLGLALTRKLVELHGGRVWVESKVSKGSVFRFTIPYPVGRAEVLGSAPLPLEIAAMDQAGPLVLVIDNDPAARDLITHYLAEAGYRVESAANGEDAIRFAHTLRPAAITLDMLLPDRDGLLILAQLKGNPDTRAIPVVVVSVTDRRELGFSLGAADWLVKPIHKAALLAALDRTVHRPSAGEPTILVVDDEPATVEYLRELLRQRGYGVLTAPGGRAGIDLALSRNPDLILLDLIMPEVNGFDVVRALRENPRARQIPIVILTAMDLTRADAERLGSSVQAVIAKGGPEQLLAELARICPVVSPALAAVPAEGL